MFKRILLLSCVAALCCATPGTVKIEQQNVPLNLLQEVAVRSLPAGRGRTSINGREFYSKFFVPEGRVRFWGKPKSNAKSRYYARIIILGDRRPYDVDIIVIKQELVKSWGKSEQSFEDIGASQKYGHQFADYFKVNLTKSLKDRNFIDDFRVF